MYAWKCWRETRARFFILLTLLCTICLGGIVLPMLSQHRRDVHLDRRSVYLHNPPEMVHLVVSDLILNGVWLCMPLVGLFLGATTSAQEFASGTIEYLWTRPRTRRWYLWTHWGVCLAELAALTAISLSLVVLSLGLLSGYWSEWRLWAAVPMFVVATLPILGLTILMTTLRRSASSGQIFTIGISLACGWLRELLNGWLHLNLPPLFYRRRDVAEKLLRKPPGDVCHAWTDPFSLGLHRTSCRPGDCVPARGPVSLASHRSVKTPTFKPSKKTRGECQSTELRAIPIHCR